MGPGSGGTQGCPVKPGGADPPRCHCWTGKSEAQHAACDAGLRWPFGSRELNQLPGQPANPKDTALSLQCSLPAKALL